MNPRPLTNSPKSAYPSPSRFALPGLFLFALLVRLLVISVAHFDGLYGQDAFAYLDYTKQVLALHLVGPFYWPLGYPIIAALFALPLGGATLGAQATCILLGAALSPLVYAITDELLIQTNMDKNTDDHLKTFPLLAGILMAISGQVLQSSIVIMSDVPALFWATLAAFALLRLRNSERWFWLPLCAVSLALAIISRWVYAGLILPFGLYFLVRHRSLIRSGGFVISISIFLLIVLSQAYFSESTAAPVLSQSWLVEWNPLNAARTIFDNPDGHFEYASPPLIFYAYPFFHPFYLPPFLIVIIFPGIWWLRRSPVLLVLGGWILSLYFYLIGIPYENFRFGLSFFPPILILLAIGMAVLPSYLMRLVVPVVLISSLASLPFVVNGLNTLFQLKADELSAARYLERVLPPHSPVITFSLTLTLQHYTTFEALELYDQSPTTLQALTCASPLPIYVFVQVDNIETQWAGKELQINFHWLRDQGGLRAIGKQTSWTLFDLKGGCARAP